MDVGALPTIDEKYTVRLCKFTPTSISVVSLCCKFHNRFVQVMDPIATLLPVVSIVMILNGGWGIVNTFQWEMGNPVNIIH